MNGMRKGQCLDWKAAVSIYSHFQTFLNKMSNSEVRKIEVFLLNLPTPEMIQLEINLLFLYFFKERCQGD